MYHKKDCKLFNSKRLRSPKNKELVTLRAIVVSRHSIRITISMGLTICELIDFNKSDRVIMKTHYKNKNMILIEKTLDEDGYKLTHSGKSVKNKKSNFLFFAIRSNHYDDYKLSETIVADYDIISSNKLIVDFSKLKWRR